MKQTTATISLFALLLLVNLLPANAEITGQVFSSNDNSAQPLEGASIQWLSKNEGTYSDEEGFFSLPHSPDDSLLVFSHIGYFNDTIKVSSPSQEIEIILESKEMDLLTFDVFSESPDQSSSFEVASVEHVSEEDLDRGSCCDLSGCFENTASVDADETDPVMKRKEIALLGLEGVQTEVMLDGQPGMVWGITRGHGLDATPGVLISDIFITKGPNSVLQTSEGAGGMVDVRLRETDDTTSLHLNSFANHHGENQHNARFSYESENWEGIGAAHFANQPVKVDDNNDGYMSIPLYQRGMAFHKGKYAPEDQPYSIETGIRLTGERRQGGDMNFKHEENVRSATFGRYLEMKQAEIWKTSKYELSPDNSLEFKINSGGAIHEGYFAPNPAIKAKQKHIQSHLQYNQSWSDHEFRGGLAWQYRQFEHDLSIFPAEKPSLYKNPQQYSVPGVFAENSFLFFDDKLTLMPGIRYDHHSEYGSFFTPRLLTRLDHREWTFQLVGGRAKRAPFPYAEYNHIYGSTRNIYFDNNIKMEQALDVGFSVFNTINRNNEKFIDWKVEAHRTYFQNQLRAQYNNSIEPSVNVSNYDLTSINNHIQAEATWHITPNSFLTGAYVFHDNFARDDEDAIRRDHNFNKHKFLLSGSVRFYDNKWQADANIHVYADHIQPNLEVIPDKLADPLRVDDYFTSNLQLMRRFNNFNIYAGIENLNDFVIKESVIDGFFSDGDNDYYLFDPNHAIGPTLGRTFYLGVNWTPFQ